jgi:hypothetical protein
VPIGRFERFDTSKNRNAIRATARNTHDETEGATKQMSSKRNSWTCAGCDVNVSYPSNATPEQPAGWAKSGRSWLCLRCRREEVMDQAAAKNGAEGWAPRRQALIEFELRRDPEATEVEVAKRAQCSSATVRKIRRALRDAGELAPA